MAEEEVNDSLLNQTDNSALNRSEMLQMTSMSTSAGGCVSEENELTPANNDSIIKMANESFHSHTLNAQTLTWSSITVRSNKDKSSGPARLLEACCKKNSSDSLDKPPDKKYIIDNVNGIAHPFEVLAIMGSSGAGKTTLLNILNFRNRSTLNVTGDVRVNGRLIESTEDIAALSGYVQQNDLFFECLTVKENLIFQAMLRMDKRFTNKQRLERVEEVLFDLNLKKCENNPIRIGDKGISGGEKRRLSFASEIITNPSILFCDEPTSGLDSFMAASIVESMKNLAKQGKTIICTIHQPSSEIFEVFDKLCLIAEGRLAFIGKLSRANEFFSTMGYQVPSNYNPADFYIKKLSIPPSDRDNAKKVVGAICDGFEKSQIHEELIQQIYKADNAHKSEANGVGDQHASTKFQNNIFGIDYKTNFFTQMRWLIWRNVLSLVRNSFVLRIQILQPIIIAIVFGLIYFRLKVNQEGIQNINGVLFLCIANNSFASMFVVLNTFPSELQIFYREHQNGMYRLVSYYLSKVMMDLPLFVLLPTMFMTICYWMADLNHDPTKFFTCVAIVVLVAQIAISFGTFLSAIAPNTDVALALSGPLLVPLMIFSGFLLNLETVPRYFLFMRYLSWFSYANEAIVINQWAGVKDIECDSMNPSCFRTGGEVVEFFKMKEQNFTFNICCLIIHFIGWRVLAYIVLLVKSSKK